MGLSTDDLAALAPVPLTYPGSETVNVRMQTEHLYAIEQHLAAAGHAPNDVADHFAALHRTGPLPLRVWLAAVTAAYEALLAK